MTPAIWSCVPSATAWKPHSGTRIFHVDLAARSSSSFYQVWTQGPPRAGLSRSAARWEVLVVRYLEKNLPRVTISIGVATFPEAGDNPQTVLKAADEALYRAKEGGRNRVELSTAAIADSDLPMNHPVAMQRALAASFYVPESPGNCSKSRGEYERLHMPGGVGYSRPPL